ncbi:hypothetical protein GCM10018966_090990 [Streptomyces yanii]
MEAGRVRAAQSSTFDAPDRFPPGTATPDGVLVMRNVTARRRPLPAPAAARW